MACRFAGLRLLFAAAAVVLTALAQVGVASAQGSFTTPNFGGGGGSPVVYSPAAACLETDPNHWLMFEMGGLMHVNATGATNALHVVTSLDVTFSVVDVFTGEVLYEGHGDLDLNEFVEMNWSPDLGVVSKTLAVDLVAPDGSSVPTLWSIEIWAGHAEDGSIFGSFGGGLVSCA